MHDYLTDIPFEETRSLVSGVTDTAEVLHNVSIAESAMSSTQVDTGGRCDWHRWSQSQSVAW
jgi:hypothetical protein